MYLRNVWMLIQKKEEKKTLFYINTQFNRKTIQNFA